MKTLPWKLTMENVKTPWENSNSVILTVRCFWRLNGNLGNRWENSVSATLSRNFMIRSWYDAMENRRTIHWKPLGKQYFPARLSATLRPRTRIPSEFRRLAKNPLKTLVEWRFCGPDGTHFTLRRDHSEAGTLCGVCPFRTLPKAPGVSAKLSGTSECIPLHHQGL